MFYYSGHAGGDGDNQDALALSDDSHLSAEDIFAGVSSGSGPRFPSSVVLSACSSSGSQGAGAGEWLGLAAAVLTAGAQQVVCTIWSVLDTKHTAMFDLTVAKLIAAGLDPAAALREAQLEGLASWRRSAHDADSRTSRSALLSVPYPLIWGAYICVGAQDEHG